MNRRTRFADVAGSIVPWRDLLLNCGAAIAAELHNLIPFLNPLIKFDNPEPAILQDQSASSFYGWQRAIHGIFTKAALLKATGYPAFVPGQPYGDGRHHPA